MAVTLAGIITTGSIYADAKPASVDTDGKYNAALGLRTDTDKNIYRMGYYHKKSTGTKKWKHLAIGDYSSPDYKEVAGTFTDVEIRVMVNIRFIWKMLILWVKPVLAKCRFQLIYLIQVRLLFQIW